MSIFSSIAVSPSGTTLLNALQVTTSAGVVLNEVVTLGDSANPANVGSVLASGAMLVEPGGVNSQPVTGTITAVQPTAANLNATVIGTVTANAGTGTLAENLTQVAGATLGATAVVNFGTAPAAVVVPAVNSALINVASTAVVSASPGIQKVGVVGNAGAAFDGATGAAPANGVAVLCQYSSTPPGPSAANTVFLQCDYEGALFVKPFRRKQTVAQATTITNSSTITTILAAQGANVFADISNLIITVTPAATADLAFTASLTDGTLTFIYDMDTGALATATADPTIININFNPALPATTANTIWQLTLSLNTVTVHVTVVAVLQKAS